VAKAARTDVIRGEHLAHAGKAMAADPRTFGLRWPVHLDGSDP
jgi:hypothetical protein